MKKLKLSASAISAYKACPVRFRNAYVLGIRPIEDTEALRIGTSWHTILEVASLEPGSSPCDCMHLIAGEHRQDLDFDPKCPICEGTGFVPDDIMDAVVRVLNKAYADVTVLDKEAKELERVRLLYALIGYRWYYANRDLPVISREQHFELPLLNPDTGHPVPGVTIQGKIDKLVQLTNGLADMEHKTTSKSIDPDSPYWTHLNMDTQTGIYIYAARRLQAEGKLGNAGDPLISRIFYDVHHKPKISPKKLTQAESKKFVEDGKYCGQKFDLVHEVWVRLPELIATEDSKLLTINDVPAEIEPGKKEGTFAIRETSEMYGARLLLDITERPEFYFCCKELVRTDAEIKALEYELYDIAKDMMSKIRANRWWHNETQCEATFRCAYTEQCYNHIALDPENPPSGMRCIFRKKEEVADDRI